MNKRWRPSVTVAAVIEHEGRFLLVEEHTPEGLKLNNPAGHLEPGETPEAAVVREALEETGREFVPEALLGVYMARFVRPRQERAGERPRPPQDITYLRFAYRGRVGEPLPERALDPAIVRTLWLTRDEIAAEPGRHRSPLLMQCIDDHLAGRRLPLEAVQGHMSLAEPVVLQPIEAPRRGRAAQAAPGNEAAPASAPGADPQRPSRSARRRAHKKMRGMQETDPIPQGTSEQAALGPVQAPAQAAGEATTAERAAELAADAVSETADGATDRATTGAAAEPITPDHPAPAAPATSPPAGTAASAQRPEPTLAETTAALAERFPALFTPGQPRPIKLRIQADIQARSQGAFTRKQLSIFLHRHTTSTAYLRALVASPKRFDLDGQPAGEVAAEHVEAAKVELERRRQIVMQRRARQAGPGPTAVEPSGDAAADGAPRPPRQERADRPHDPRGPHGARGPQRPARPGQPAGPGRGPRADRPHPPGRPDRFAEGEHSPHPHGGRPERHAGRAGPGPAPGAGRSDRHAARPPFNDNRAGPQRPARPPATDEVAAALPHDPERRERALLLRSFEGSPLTAANYCALKGLVLADFEAQVALARREREERQRGGTVGA